MIAKAQITHKDIYTFRPDQHRGGREMTRVQIHADLEAHVSERQELVRDRASNTAERTIITVFRFNTYDKRGEILNLQAGDFISFPDYRGVRQEREIVIVEPLYVAGPGKIDHFVVITGQLSRRT